MWGLRMESVRQEGDRSSSSETITPPPQASRLTLLKEEMGLRHPPQPALCSQGWRSVTLGMFIS